MPKVSTTERQQEPIVQRASPPEVQPVSDTAIIEVPIDRSVPTTTWGLHLDCELTADQGLAARRVASALDKQQARLRNGRRVVDATAAIKFVLEKIE